LLGPAGGARAWSSFSPLVLPRYAKRRGRNTFGGQLAAELRCRGLPPAAVDFLAWDDQTRALRHAVRVRRHPARPPPVDSGIAVRLRFQEPVRGPIALGYGSHYGLGLFVAVEDPG
jgi:CRISPR-associated protein Csb2